MTTSGRARHPALSPDGRLLAYTEGGRAVVQGLASRGTTVPVLSDKDRSRVGYVEHVAWSADAATLFLESDTGLFIVPFPGGQPRLVLHGSRGYGFMRMSPNGNRALSWGSVRKHALLHDQASGRVDTLAVPGTYNWLWQMMWAPDGRAIASLTVQGSNEYTIRRHDLRDGSVSVILRDSVPVELLSWSRNDNTMYFARGFTMDPTGPVGGQLRRVSMRSRQPANAELVSPELHSLELSVANDGSTATVRAQTASNLSLIRVGADTTPKALTRGTALRQWPRFSPSGAAIAFREHDGVVANLFLVDAAGGTARQLTFFQDEQVTDHAWSPDGSRIAFCSLREGGQRLGLVRVASGELQWPFAPTLGNNCGLGWLSDTVVVYHTPGNRDFVLHSLTSGTTRRLIGSDTIGFIFYPVAHPRGSPLLVWWNRRGQRGIWQITDTSRQLLRLGELMPLWLDSSGTLLTRTFSRSMRVEFHRLHLARPDSAELIASVARCTIGELSADASQVICPVETATRDIWLMRPARATSPRRP